jgi:hypothetical protein
VNGVTLAKSEFVQQQRREYGFIIEGAMVLIEQSGPEVGPQAVIEEKRWAGILANGHRFTGMTPGRFV